MSADFSQTELAFAPETLQTLNIALALVMFGVSMSLKVRDFKTILSSPRAISAGLVSQWLLLPALTVLLIWIIRPQPSIALGMVLVASCPGGSVSNFLTFLARGNTALSISLTAISSAGAILITPLCFSFWGGLSPGTEELLTRIAVNPWNIAKTILIVLLIPLVLGILISEKLPWLASRLDKPARIFSFLFLLAFIVFTSVRYWPAFEDYLFQAGWMVILHNLLALGVGWGLGAALGLELPERRTLSVETGIQNTGLGLLLIFSYFNGMGGMALVAAWYGVWHIASGLIFASLAGTVRGETENVVADSLR